MSWNTEGLKRSLDEIRTGLTDRDSHIKSLEYVVRFLAYRLTARIDQTSPDEDRAIEAVIGDLQEAIGYIPDQYKATREYIEEVLGDPKRHTA